MKNRKMPKGLLEARMLPETFDEKSRTVEVVWSTGMAVKRFDYWEGEFYMEELSMEPESIRMERLQNGAPVLNTHSQYRLEDVIGVVESASIESERGLAVVKLSDTEEDANIVRKIKDGIIRNISVGYKIHKAEQTRDEEANMSTYRVIDWEPLEISFVPVPADFNSQVRGEELEQIKNSIQSFDCEVITIPTGGERMDEKDKNILLRNEEESNAVDDKAAEESSEIQDEGVKPEEVSEEEASTEEDKTEEASEESTEEEVSDEDAERNLKVAERTRVTEIMSLCKKHNVKPETEKRFIEKEISVKDAGSEILKEIEKRNDSKKTNNKVEISGMENKQLRKEAMVRGILHSVDPTKNKLKDGDSEYRASTLQGAARMYLANELGERNVHSMTKSEVAQRALHHTSDFPLILEDICNKFLMDGYSEVAATYQPFIRNRSVSDFKEISESRLSSGGILKKVNEHGEYKRSSLASDGEKYRVEKFGEIIGATEELLINDDLGAFTSLPQELGAKVARTENEIFWELIYTPQVMSDGNPLFHASHNNLGTAGVISETTLSEARKLMRLQKDIDGKKRLNIRPAFLVVPAGLETVAEKFLTTIQADSATNVNPFGASMQMIVEPILDDASATAWYTFGSLAQGPMAVKAMLDGRGPQISVRENWDIDGMETKIKYSFGMRVVDHRQFFKNLGA